MRLLLVFSGFFAVIAVALLINTTPQLMLFSFDGDVLFTRPAYEGLEFSVEFIHSVNQSPVAEIFVIRNNEIVLQALEFKDFGAGMPTEIEYGQKLVHLPSGMMRIEGFNRTMDNLHYMVGHAACLVLYIKEERVPLSNLAEPGTLIRIETRGRINVRI